MSCRGYLLEIHAENISTHGPARGIVMRPTVSTLTILCVISFCVDSFAQSRLWSDVYGNASTGTFQRFRKDSKGDPGNDRVVIRANGRIVGLKFWELMPDSQQFVKQQLAGDEDGDHLEITDVPHDWTSRAGVKGTGQFLKVEDDGKIAVVIAAEKKLFEFEEFCDEDQDYIRAVLARSGKENLVPAKPDAPKSPQQFSNTPVMTTPDANAGGFPTSTQPEFNITAPTITRTSPSSNKEFDALLDSMNSGSTERNLPNMSSGPSTAETTSPMTNSYLSNFGRPVTTHSCSECGKDIKATATTCPHCNVKFDYIEGPNGERTYVNGNTEASLQAEGRRNYLNLKLGLVVLVLVGSGLANCSVL